MRKIISVYIMILFISILWGAEYPDFSRHIEKTNKMLQIKLDGYAILAKEMQQNRDMDSYDITYYLIDINLNFEEEDFSASNVIQFDILQSISFVEFNCESNLLVSSVKKDGMELDFSQMNELLIVELGQFYEPGQNLALEVDYTGVPISRLEDGLKFEQHSDEIVAFTMVSPMGARRWWPCKDTPADKPEELDMWITYPSQYISASNGLLVEQIDNGDGTRTDKWHESYPVATYLTSLAVTNYQMFVETFELDDQQINIDNYLYPEIYNACVDLFDETDDMLEFFSGVYGPYPFMNEKYGHAVCTNLGALAIEHQTCTSFTSSYISDSEATYTVAHELAHQWAGDCLSIADWSHVWLKEGFARYSEALWAEHLYGFDAYKQYMDDLDTGSALDPMLYRDPELGANHIFDIVIYNKGGWTLHMLRGVLGEEDFFATIYQLMQDPLYKYGNFSTDDFKEKAEAVSGMELDWFFDQWFLQEGRPRYNYTVYQNDFEEMVLAIESLPQNGNYFTMPVTWRAGELTNSFQVEGGMNHFFQNMNIDLEYLEMDPDNYVLDYGFIPILPVLEQVETREGMIGLIWEEFFDDEIVGLDIYRNSAGEEFEKINEEPINGTYFLDTDLQLGTAYSYKIMAVYNYNGSLLYSGFSNEITIEAIDYTFDDGILLVDNSRDFSAPFPTDEEIDEFYFSILDGYGFTNWDIANQGTPPLSEMARYSTIIWHSDDILQGELTDNFYNIKNYLAAGGNLLLSGCRYLSTISTVDRKNFLGIEEMDFSNNPDFGGAIGTYLPSISIDPENLPLPTWTDGMAYVYKFTPWSTAQIVYSYNSTTDDPEFEGTACGLKVNNNLYVLGFPLYFCMQDEVQVALQNILTEFNENTIVETSEIPAVAMLSNYPNPFNPAGAGAGRSPGTTISYNLPVDVTNPVIEIFNIKGEKIITLSSAKQSIEGQQYEVTWDGRDKTGRSVSSGVYFYKLNVENSPIKKMLLMK